MSVLKIDFCKRKPEVDIFGLVPIGGLFVCNNSLFMKIYEFYWSASTLNAVNMDTKRTTYFSDNTAVRQGAGTLVFTEE